MRKSAVDAVIRGLKTAGVSVVCYLPDSLFKELYPALDADPDIRTIRVTNEGEGAAICGGVFLSGKKAALVMENSGLRASVEPLARMGLGAGIPVVMLMSYRGELGENNWWAIPHGITMEPVLDALRIPVSGGTRGRQDRARDRRCLCLVLRLLLSLGGSARRRGGAMKRFDCMKALAARLKDELVILSLGASVDEWYNAAPHMRSASLFQQQLGCVTPQAFGLAVGLPHRRIVSLDTDGGMMFNLGILATLGNEQPKNLFVVVWDNECYQSIGGPPTHTASGRVDLAAIARGAGIDHAFTVRTVEEFDAHCARGLASDVPYVVVAKVAGTVQPDIKRKHSDGREDKYIFVRHVEATENIVIMGPSEHN